MTRRILWLVASPVRSFLARHKRIGAIVVAAAERIPRLQDAVLALARGDPQERYRRWVAAFDTLDEGDLSAIDGAQSRLGEPPVLSLVVPVTGADVDVLKPLLDSLQGQTYGRWELWIVREASLLGGSDAAWEHPLLLDGRCRIVTADPHSLAESANDVLRTLSGEFAVLIDPRVSLRPHSLYLYAHAIEEHPGTVLVYADDDVVDRDGMRSEHRFKPDWNEALLRSQNYLGGIVAFHRASALERGGCRDEGDGDLAWGLFLRLTANAHRGTILHLPFVLSQRRRARADGREEARRRRLVARALEQRLAEIDDVVRVEPVGRASYRATYALPEQALSVSIVVPSTGNPDLLRPCLESLLERTAYPRFELVVVLSHGATEAHDNLGAGAVDPRVRVLSLDEAPFNFSRTNNWAAERSTADVLCFLNDDTEVLDGDWLSTLVAQLGRERVAAAGALLVYPDGRIQHAGVILGAGGVAAHSYERGRKGTGGYNERALVDQDVSCVTAACMAVRSQVFRELGGFDEALAVAFNDVDFCLRMTEAGWRIVWTPGAWLRHQASASIGRHDRGPREADWNAAFDLMQDRWGPQLTADPHYSPNLSLDPLLLWEPCFPPRVSYPWRVQAAPEEPPALRRAASRG